MYKYLIFKTLYKFNHYMLFIFDFFIPKDTTKESQVLDRKPINNPIQGRCY